MFLKAQAQLSEASKGKKLLFLATGTRGDVQPLVALAAGCKGAGFEVLVVTRGSHMGFFEAFGLAAVDCDYIDNMRGRGRDRSQDEWTPCAQNHEEQASLTPGALRGMFEFATDFRPDLILSGLPCLAPCHAFAEKLGVPAMECCLRIAAPTGEQSSPLGEPEGWPGCCHYLLWLAYRRGLWRGYQRMQLPVLRAVLKMQSTPCAWSTLQAHLLDTVQPLAPSLVPLSPVMTTVPSDAFPQGRAPAPCGFLVVSRQDQLTKADHMFGCRAVLRAFVDAGEAPLYFGWGPMVARGSRFMACLAVGSARAAGRRAVILCGGADLAPGLLVDEPALQKYAEGQVLFVRSAPHEWLFPRCAAVVHHGGLGTTVSSLRSGVPTIITACNAEQRAQARLVSKLGVGSDAGFLEGLCVADLVAAVQRCTSDQAILDRCRQVGELMQKENGVKASVEHIDAFFKVQMATGGWRLASEKRRREKCILRKKGPDGCFSWCHKVFAKGSRGSLAPQLKKPKGKGLDEHNCFLSCCAPFSLYNAPKHALSSLALPGQLH